MLPLTVDSLRAAYDYLDTTPPFDKWNLPSGEDVVFKVGRTEHECAWVNKTKRKAQFTIMVSQRKTGHTNSLMAHMAHEMIHVHLFLTGMDNQSGHNAAFKKLAIQVCQFHGFDINLFY